MCFLQWYFGSHVFSTNLSLLHQEGNLFPCTLSLEDLWDCLDVKEVTPWLPRLGYQKQYGFHLPLFWLGYWPWEHRCQVVRKPKARRCDTSDSDWEPQLRSQLLDCIRYRASEWTVRSSPQSLSRAGWCQLEQREAVLNEPAHVHLCRKNKWCHYFQPLVLG